MKQFLLTSVMLSMLVSTSSLFPVLIYPSKRTDSTETSFTAFTSVSSSSRVVDISFCFWVKVNHLSGAKVLHYELKDTKGFGFTLQEHYGFLNLKIVDLLFDYNSPHVPDKWSHFCVVYDSSVESVTIYMNGTVTFEKYGLDVLDGMEFHENLLSHITVGTGGGGFSQPFNGEFCQFMVWNKVIQQDDVERQMECGDVDKEGLELDWTTVNMERGDTVLMKDIEAGCPSALDEDSESLAGFSQRVKFDEAGTACLALGGRQDPPMDEVEVKKISESLGGLKDMCNSKFWVPVRQQSGRWVSSASSSLVSYLPWTPGQPNGGRHQACAEAKFNKINGSFQGYNDLNCGKSIRCFYCYIKNSKRFRLRGMCLQAGADSHYIGSVETRHQITRPYWKGYRKTEISFSTSSNSWTIKDISTEQVLATYNGSFIWPVGRQSWHVQAGVCGPEDMVKDLTLSSCSDSEFTCGDGTCIPLESKCNGMSDCKDELDESDCSLVEFPKKRQYKESLPPIGRLGKEVLPAKVGVSIDIMSVTNIKETSMKWGCKLQLNMTWLDGRLRWRDLRENSNLNVITNQDQGSQEPGQVFPVNMAQPSIWVATVIFANSPNNDFSVTDAKASLTVEKKGNLSISPLEQLQEVAYYEGSENPVTYMRKFKKDFACNFQLHTYPFDTQYCNIVLQTPDHLTGLMKLLAKKVTYSGPVEMLQYNVINWEIREVEEGLEVMMTLQRRFNHHLATTFIPTFCLMIVCQSTLYFNAEHFKTTSGVTVTTMLVMYTLYQAVSHKLPPTSYIKMIDVWLIFGLILPFCVFFLLVLIDHLPSVHPGEATVSKVSSTKAALVMIAHYILPIIILLFTLSYTTAAILIYNGIV